MVEGRTQSKQLLGLLPRMVGLLRDELCREVLDPVRILSLSGFLKFYRQKPIVGGLSMAFLQWNHGCMYY